jgi:hypothetical protein
MCWWSPTDGLCLDEGTQGGDAEVQSGHQPERSSKSEPTHWMPVPYGPLHPHR